MARYIVTSNELIIVMLFGVLCPMIYMRLSGNLSYKLYLTLCSKVIQHLMLLKLPYQQFEDPPMLIPLNPHGPILAVATPSVSYTIYCTV